MTRVLTVNNLLDNNPGKTLQLILVIPLDTTFDGNEYVTFRM